VLDALAADGLTIDPVLRDGLALATQKARGDKVTKATLTTARAAADAACERYRHWKTPTEKRIYWGTGEVATVLYMALSGEDCTDNVLRQSSYGLGLDDGERAEAQTRAWYAAALADAGALSAAPTARKVPAAQAAALARMAKALGKRGALLGARGARFAPKRTAEPAAVKRLLAREKYPVHASVLAFERMFGGLLIPDELDGPDDEATLLGTYGCLRSRAHVHPEGGRTGLVPVAYTSNDGIVFLDRAGKAYYQDSIEDVRAKAFASTGAAAVIKLLAD
jgi:hypothetical protein